MIRALILDFDGTIVDSETPEGVAWSQVYAEHGHELDVAAVIAGAGHVGTQQDAAHRLAALLGDPSRSDELMDAQRGIYRGLVEAEPIRPGILRWLDEARALGWQTAVASSSKREWVVPHLERLGLVADLDAVCCGDEVEHRKPSPDVYLLAASRLGIEPAAALAVEDSVHGAIAAQAAGMAVVVTPNSYTAHQVWPDHYQHVDPSTIGLAELVARYAD